MLDLDAIFGPFVDGSPVTVMAAAAAARLLSPGRLDALFEEARGEQYAGELLFSTVFGLMADVVTGKRQSIHHAYQSAEEQVKVSVVAVYDKLKRVEPGTSRAVVRDLAAEVGPLVDQMGGALPPLLPGRDYDVRVIDGNCIEASEHRIKELRGTAAGALPGKSLVVLDPRRRLMVDVVPCEDGHAQERSLLGDVLPSITAGQLWVEDRNFCTFDFLWGIEQRRAFFVTRLHGNMQCVPRGPRARVGESESGTVYEQPVLVRGEGGRELHLRRVDVELKEGEATRDGDTTLSLLTNLPAEGRGAVGAVEVAGLYRSRWRIETAFQELEGLLNSEVNALGYPRAALFGFCVALVVFNSLSLVRAALRGRHGAQKVEAEVSDYYIAAELKSTSRGMMIAVPLPHWRVFGAVTAAQFAQSMLALAGKVNLRHFKKHPRGPKKPRPPRTYDPEHPHVSTAKLLEQRKAGKTLTM